MKYDAIVGARHRSRRARQDSRRPHSRRRARRDGREEGRRLLHRRRGARRATRSRRPRAAACDGGGGANRPRRCAAVHRRRFASAARNIAAAVTRGRLAPLPHRSRAPRRRGRARRATSRGAAIPISRFRITAAGGTSKPAASIARRARPRAGRSLAAERARAQIDLAVVSVLLDAGAGPAWGYLEDANRPALHALGRPRRRELSRVHATARSRAGARSVARRCGGAGDDRRGDARRRCSRSSDDNPLVGLDGRAALLRRLGRR